MQFQYFIPVFKSNSHRASEKNAFIAHTFTKLNLTPVIYD